MMLPLDGITVIDFSQFLSGPLATLKLADLGARVIKIERPGTGDLCRTLYLSDTEIGGMNSLFQAINRNKDSFSADLRDPDDRALVRGLIAQADVVVQNFRPGVIERQGFGYEDVRSISPNIVYGSISGYGEAGPWVDLPGQDLLAQGILAGLVRKARTGKGAQVQTSLLEALLDFQFEVLTTYLNDGRRAPHRSAVNGAHAYLGAPYGVYRTADGWFAIAMTPSLERLATLMQVPGLERWYGDAKGLMRDRDEIKRILAKAIEAKTTAYWISILQPADIWCAEVTDWPRLLESEAFRRLSMIQNLSGPGVSLETLRGPLRIDGEVLTSSKPAPELGADKARIIEEFGLTAGCGRSREQRS